MFAGHDLGPVVSSFPDALFVVDMPIGLPDYGRRLADAAARRRLGARRSSVFPAPPRPLLAATSWEAACRIGRGLDGRRCSRQVWNLLPRIRAVDALMTPEVQERVVEGHPEVSFAAMAKGTGLATSKHTLAGHRERVALLRRHLGEVGSLLARLPAGLRGDAVDALALLWSARRLSRSTARRLPEDTVERDARGLRCEIVY